MPWAGADCNRRPAENIEQTGASASKVEKIQVEKPRPEKIWAVIPAAGIGKRMGSPQPKQYLPLLKRRVLDHALLSLCRNDSVAGVIAGISACDRWWRAQPFEHDKLVAVSRGGAQRAHTVLNALRQLLRDNIAAADDWVMVHDAVRPCIRQADIERLVTAARLHGAGAVLAVRLVDTLKRANREGVIEETLGAGKEIYWRALTPQMFRCGPLKAALQHALAQGIAPTDESAAMEAAGLRAVLVEGHPTNIKITVPADLELAARYLEGFALREIAG